MIDPAVIPVETRSGAPEALGRWLAREPDLWLWFLETGLVRVALESTEVPDG
jgi:hypothetical protein